MDRSERVRTYNFPENRIADHRVGYKAHNLDQVLDGDLDAVIGALVEADRSGLAASGEGVIPAAGGRRQPGRPAVTLLLDEVAIAAARLAEAGVESPRADAEVIAAHVHGVRRGELHLVPDAGFDPRFWVEIARREAREPLQHITGLTHFRYTELAVGPGVFVPRPETEVMTGWAIDKLTAMDVADPVVVDLGTGSGAIALAIAQEVPRAQVHAVEADPLARGWASATSSAAPNTHRTPRAGSYCTPRTSPAPCRNWTPRWTWSSATPRTSLSGRSCRPRSPNTTRRAHCGAGPTAWTRSGSSRTAARLLRPDGLVAVEHGAPQGAAVYWVFAEERGWADTRNHKDLARRDRFVTARWPGR